MGENVAVRNKISPELRAFYSTFRIAQDEMLLAQAKSGKVPLSMVEALNAHEVAREPLVYVGGHDQIDAIMGGIMRRF